jgi:hypothetical protein
MFNILNTHILEFWLSCREALLCIVKVLVELGLFIDKKVILSEKKSDSLPSLLEALIPVTVQLSGQLLLFFENPQLL